MPRSSSRQAEKTSKKPEKVIKLDKKRETEVLPEDSKILLEGLDPDELIFALDIGTRTVIGVVGIQEKDKFKVLAAEIIEHKNRAMLDGQIHDINRVAEIAKEVKEILEKKLGISLARVAIAAAGRVLRTCEVKVEHEIDSSVEIDKEIVSSIELEGIQKAQKRLDEETAKDDKTQFYCVGYSVINYYINGYVISSLLGHKAKKIGMDILATFLPHVVVDSLYTVMSKIGLEVVSLTLEPIAAINVTIPKDLRLLNLALVDIGAGTSDIAITKDGSVIAYAMAPLAGDEITERIAQHYLVDFNTAEKIKVAISQKGESITFTDILKKKNVVRINEVLEVIKPTIDLLAGTIANKILEYNQKAPNAVFLIGGGSQIPGLTNMVADYLKLPHERVVVRGREIIQNIKFSGKKLSGPEAITPIGIAVTAQMQRGQDFLSVVINGKKVRLFNSKQLTVADALILIGFNPNQLIGRSGKSINYELNGEKRVARGEFGKPAEIYINDEPANLGTKLRIGDNIVVKAAEDGKDASLKVSDIVSLTRPVEVSFNGSIIDVGTKVFINGKTAASDIAVSDGDVIQVEGLKTLKDLVKFSEIDTDEYLVSVNDKDAEEEYVLLNGDIIECRKKESEAAAEEEAEFTQAQSEIPVKSGNEITIDIGNLISEVKAEEVPAGSMTVIINGKPTVIKGDKTQYIFVDMFNYINFDLSRPQGNIVLRLNGVPAAFTDIVKHGDKIDIYWEKAV